MQRPVLARPRGRQASRRTHATRADAGLSPPGSFAERVLGSEGAGVMVAGIDRQNAALITAQRRDADAGAAYSISITADAAMAISRQAPGRTPTRRVCRVRRRSAIGANAPAILAAQASVASGLQLTSAFTLLATCRPCAPVTTQKSPAASII
ncbi:MAG: hypothetical protein R3C40_10075 [Parvularculaceae bacterium]